MKLKEWWSTKAWPWLTTVAFPKGRSCMTEWWNDLGDKPRSHFISMVVGMALLGAVKFLVRLAS